MTRRVRRVATADVSGEVFGGEFERRQRRLLPDLAGDDLIDGFAAVDVLGERLLRERAAQPRRHRRRVSVERVAQLRDDGHLLPELLERLEDWSELEVERRRWRGPEAGPLAERHEHGAESARRVRGCLRPLPSKPAPSPRGTAAPAWRPCHGEPSDAVNAFLEMNIGRSCICC